jgi:hypothetical protein
MGGVEVPVTNAERALWMVLITSLATPFFAGLAAAALALVAPLIEALPVITKQAAGGFAISVFAWSALPSTIAAIGLTPYVLQEGTYGWLHAAVAGVLAFGASAVIAPFEGGAAMPLLAFLAGATAIAVRDMLIRGRILKP